MTREEAIKWLNIELKAWENDCLSKHPIKEALSVAIKDLEQEPVIDKIRAEIEKSVWEDVIVSLDGTDEVRIPRLEPDDVFEIIDKYKAESEK